MYEIRVACLEKQVFGDIRITTVGYSRKKNEQGGGWWRYGIFRGSKEITCGFQEWPRKNNVEFPGILLFSLRISKKYS